MTTPILCDDQHCSLPVARVVNDVLVIESRHHGKVHRNTISLQRLLNLLTLPQSSAILRNDGVLEQDRVRPTPP